MSLIADTTVRLQIEATLQEIQAALPEVRSEGLDIAAVDQFARTWIEQSRTQCLESSRPLLEPEISISYFGVLTLGALHRALASRDVTLFPADRISPTGAPDPTFIFSGLISTLTNSALGVIILAEAGLESPARVVVRNFAELSWLTLLAFHSRDVMTAYTETDEELEKNAYYKYLKAKRLLEELAKLEARSDSMPRL